jgi:hypothetical protein
VNSGGRINNVPTFVGQWIGAAIIFSNNSIFNGISDLGRIYIDGASHNIISPKTLLTQADDGKIFIVEHNPFPALCLPQNVTSGEIGIESSFSILCHPEEGGGYPIGVAVKGPSSTSDAILDKIEDKSYRVHFTPNEQGEHVATVTFEITKQVHISVGAWHPDASQCIAYGPGLEAGEQFAPAVFTIEARNKLGDKIPVGGHNFHGKVKDPLGNEIPIAIKDNDDGTYEAIYTPFFPGDHVVEVYLDNHSVPSLRLHTAASPVFFCLQLQQWRPLDV